MSDYTVYVLPDAWQELKQLPGSVRQRVKREVDGLAKEPRPPQSRLLRVPGFAAELRRLRLERWRIVYAISEVDRAVDVLAVRKRPPYDYGDLAELLGELR